MNSKNLWNLVETGKEYSFDITSPWFKGMADATIIEKVEEHGEFFLITDKKEAINMRHVTRLLRPILSTKGENHE